MRYSHLTLLIAATISPCRNVYAHQPVMDMAPRWDNGYGFQLRYESYGADTLIEGNRKVENPQRLERFVRKTWLEGVYTFDRSIRVTLKLPYIVQNRIKSINGAGVKQGSSGWGDVIIGMPLKKYLNRGDRTGNISLTPSLRIPSGSAAGDFPISDGSWDAGISLSYSKSTAKFYQLYDLFYWYNTQGERGMHEGNEWGLDINTGYHPYHNNLNNAGVFVMWDISARHQGNPNTATLTSTSGGSRIHTGPIIALYRDNIMLRAEYKTSVYEERETVSPAHGDEFTIGVGLTF